MKAVIFVLLSWACSLAVGQTPIVAENLLVSQPTGFTVGFVSNNDNNTMTEFVPAGETVENWTQMLTVQVYRRSPLDSAAFLQGVGKLFVDACPATTVVGKGIQSGKVNGYVVSMLLLKCPQNPRTGKPEIVVFRAIKGQDALYLMQRAWRVVPSDQDLDAVMHTLASVTVCDTRVPEHPCPDVGPPRAAH